MSIVSVSERYYFPSRHGRDDSGWGPRSPSIIIDIQIDDGDREVSEVIVPIRPAGEI